MIPRKIFSLFSLRLASNIDRAIIDHGSLLMDLGESSFLALATAESSVCLRRGQKNPHQTVPPSPASNDAAKSIPSPESRKQVNVSRIPNLKPATCPFVFHLPLRPFEMNDSSHERASYIYIYSRGCVLFE